VKDYYSILGIPENASQADIKAAFRKLAFQYHPDTNPGNKKWAEEKFKEINEAYCVLGDEAKKRQYDSARRGQFAGAGYGDTGRGFQYSQQDIFRSGFTNQTLFEELNRMFAQQGLRFDQDFLNRVFFRGGTFVFYATPGYGSSTAESATPYGKRVNQQSNAYSGAGGYQPNLVERWFFRAAVAAGRFLLNRLLGLRDEHAPALKLDQHLEIEVSAAEVQAGSEKQISIRRDGRTRKLMVKIPPGIKNGARIRLKGMGEEKGGRSGDLYLQVKINL